MQKEKIICSAVYYNNGETYIHQPFNIKTGIVICGHRHHNALFILSKMNLPINKRQITPGFLTNTNKFVNRKEAYKIAKSVNQIVAGNIICLHCSIHNFVECIH
jgi:hypothetical protein